MGNAPTTHRVVEEVCRTHRRPDSSPKVIVKPPRLSCPPVSWFPYLINGGGVIHMNSEMPLVAWGPSEVRYSAQPTILTPLLGLFL